MKNIHVLPTDKPSMLIKQGKNLNELFLYTRPIDFRDNELYPLHIYITDDSEIKIEDWCLYVFTKSVFKYGKGLAKAQTTLLNATKKIILTTDQDLIADGVQEISEDFLQWFVKNSSCEFAEVKEKQHFEADKSKRINPLNGVHYSYKIIIPQEELKQEFGKPFVNSKKMENKETLEELYFKRNPHRKVIVKKRIDDFIAGTECQAERMYSEEEVRKISIDFFYHWWNSKGTNTEQGFDKWFSQFKKTKDGI